MVIIAGGGAELLLLSSFQLMWVRRLHVFHSSGLDADSAGEWRLRSKIHINKSPV